MANEEKNSCKNCKFCYSGMNYNYRVDRVEHKEMDGFICAAFADEGIMIHMSGLVGTENDVCEMFKRRGEKR